MRTISDEYSQKAATAVIEVQAELARAKSIFTENFHNFHEGYAVLLEEVDELWTEVKKNQRDYDIEAMRKEAKQIAAMALRIMIELT